MNSANDTLAWSMFVELRKELVESQRIRAQVIGFKITFVSAILAACFSGKIETPAFVLLIPAFAAISFDFLINSYSFSIKRIGAYQRAHLEPRLKRENGWDTDEQMWEQYLAELNKVQESSGKTPVQRTLFLTAGRRQGFSTLGNLVFTLVTCVAGLAGAWASIDCCASPERKLALETAGVLLVLLFLIDVTSFLSRWTWNRHELPQPGDSSAPIHGKM